MSLDLQKKKIFNENIYDIETFFESLSIASNSEKELLYIDKFITKLRETPHENLTLICHTSLKELNLIKEII